MINIYNCDCNNLIKSKELQNKKIVIVTDPPFNIGYHYNNYKDKMKEKDYYNFLTNILKNNGFPFVVIHYPEQLYKIAFYTESLPDRVVSWVYNSNTARQHRDIAFFGINPDFKKVRQPYKNLNDKRIKKRIAEGKTGAKLYDWWNVNQIKNVSKEKTKHPCQMPVEVMKNIIGILPEDFIIFDPFMGSGTTGVAAIELKRDFIGCELDEEYFLIAKERLEKAAQEMDQEIKASSEIIK
jgi:DNA modification methylase